MKRNILNWTLIALATGAVVGCSSRPEYWDEAPKPLAPVGLQSTVSVVDESIHAVQQLRFDDSLQLQSSRLATGKNVRKVVVSPDRKRLFVLSAGVTPRRKPTDERPALWVYDGTGSGKLIAKYPLSDALGGLALDPEGRYAVVYASGSSDAFVQNPNELLIIDTTQPPGPDNPLPRTLRSFGGSPQRLTFTSTLHLPTGNRRLLLVETDRDLSIIDLEHLERKELTVKLSDNRQLKPAGLVYSDGAPDRNDDARIAIRTTSESSVYLLQLVKQTNEKASNDFTVLINVIAVGGQPSDMAFVNTDAGERLAVLVPNRRQAVLADPSTTVTTEVKMPESYGEIDVITQQVKEGNKGESDVALLWGGASARASGVAFWSLGRSVGQPYRSIEQLPSVGGIVERVIPVPAPHQTLRILVPSSASNVQQLQVLDLKARTASPLLAEAQDVQLTISSDGERAWLYQEGSYQLAVLDFNNLHPRNLTLARPIWRVFDIQSTGSKHVVVALHRSGSMAATVLDAKQPDETGARAFVGLLQGGM